VAGLLLIIGEELDEKSDADLVSYYADSGNRTGDIVGFLLVAIGLVFFLVFVSVLRERMRSADGDGTWLSGLAAAGGVTAAALFLAGNAALFAPSLAADFIDELTVDPDSVRLFLGLGFALIVGAVVLSCGLVLATSAAAFRGQVFPAWVGWLGLLAVVLAVLETLLLPVFVIPVWSLIVGVVLAMRAPEPQQAVALDSSTT
jgi:hypothetical protein